MGEAPPHVAAPRDGTKRAARARDSRAKLARQIVDTGDAREVDTVGKWRQVENDCWSLRSPSSQGRGPLTRALLRVWKRTEPVCRCVGVWPSFGRYVAGGVVVLLFVALFVSLAKKTPVLKKK